MNENSTHSFFKNTKGFWEETPKEFHNRGFLFGDGLFETMVFENNMIRFSDYHQERLVMGCATLQLNTSQLSDIAEIERLLINNGFQGVSKRIRWNVYRSGQGKYTPVENGIQETLQISAFSMANPLKSKAAFSSTFRVPSTIWSHCKTINGLHYVMANLERIEKSLDEIILLNDKGYVSEAGSSNIFWEIEGVFYTPSLESSCIAGVSRRVILEKLKDLGKKVGEGIFLKTDLMQAERVFTSNVTGICMIENIEGNTFKTSGLPPELFMLFK
ncbi:MAG: aminodeoxychorismate lyase [Mongoliibacter sp.]|uniref:aminotransferase class IV n=1 Tax=Mongoliibacter sp. TaxID=2022438 RepID=UPI0012F1FE30|nr:aminotransferase class IV [Mongoliibacter sp.]TVP47618.1 MAG: aminodeoxychorismate lyase [Mongoliibacter sp.]